MLSVTITGDILIGSAAINGADRPLRAINPDTGAKLEPAFAYADATHVAKACDLAWSAFHPYRQTSLEQRAKFLETIASNIMELGDALVERAVAETGLPKARIEGERGRTVGQLRLFAEVVRKGEWLDLRVDEAMPDRKPLPRSDLRLRQVPLGPVVVFGASNFPLAFSVAGGDTASAFAAGCPVIVKSHPAHPGTGELVGRAIQAAVQTCGMPEGTFSLLLGNRDMGSKLVEHPHVKAVGFTGSRSGGVALCNLAANRPEPIPVYAEMSSINPVFLLPAALAARAEQLGTAFIDSLTMGAGQFCTNPGLVLALDGPDLERFVTAASAALAPRVPAPMLTPGIYQAFESGVQALAGNPAVTTVARGAACEGANRGPGALFMTDAASFLKDERLSHEVFGASSVLIRCNNIDEMAKVAERVEGQLTATLHMDAADAELARRLLPVLESKAGRILANGWPTGVEVCHSMVHGGPFPATSDSRTTSVGTLAIRRFLRPVCYQDIPADLLPTELQPAKVQTLPHLRNGVRS